MNAIRFLFLLFFLIVFSGTKAHAAPLECPGALPSPEEALEEADAVFVGTATDDMIHADRLSESHLKRAGVTPPTTVIFRVHQSWKGTAQNIIPILTHMPHQQMFGFMLGETYLIYAYKDISGNWYVPHCSRTRFMRDATEDLGLLGPAKTVYKEPF